MDRISRFAVTAGIVFWLYIPSLLADGLIFEDAFETIMGGGSTEPPAMSGMTATHNQVRADVQPPANTALPAIEWDNDLAAIAQAWTDNCVYQHSGTVGLGENLYAYVSTSPMPVYPSPQNVVDSWASEAQYYNYASNTCAAGHVCGHYTQIVWRDSTSLGCGVTVCPAASNPFSPPFNVYPWQFWSCNYQPPGNYIGQRPY